MPNNQLDNSIRLNVILPKFNQQLSQGQIVDFKVNSNQKIRSVQI